MNIDKNIKPPNGFSQNLQGNLNYFDSPFDLMDHFNTEEKCTEYLIQIRWGGSRPICENCNSNNRVYYIKSRKTFKCSNCNGTHSVKKGTIFQNSNLPLRKWFLALQYFAKAKQGYTSLNLASDINVQQKSAWFMLQKIKYSIENSYENNMLIGIVEIDETQTGALKNRDKRVRTKVDKRRRTRIKMDAEGEREKASREKTKKYKSKKSTPSLMDVFDTLPDPIQRLLRYKEDRMIIYQPIHYKMNIVGALERNIKDYNGKVIKRGNLILTKIGRQIGEIRQNSLLPFMAENIHPDSHIITDSAGYYNNVGEYFRQHSKINHSKGEYVNGYKSTNAMENVWRQLKDVYNRYRGYSWKHADGYLNEFVFRYNLIGKSVSEATSAAFCKALSGYVSQKEIVSRPAGYLYIAR